MFTVTVFLKTRAVLAIEHMKGIRVVDGKLCIYNAEAQEPYVIFKEDEWLNFYVDKRKYDV